MACLVQATGKRAGARQRTPIADRVLGASREVGLDSAHRESNLYIPSPPPAFEETHHGVRVVELLPSHWDSLHVHMSGLGRWSG